MTLLEFLQNARSSPSRMRLATCRACLLRKAEARAEILEALLLATSRIEVLTPQAMTEPLPIARSLIAATQGLDKPVLASWMGGDAVAAVRPHPGPDAAAARRRGRRLPAPAVKTRWPGRSPNR